MVDDVDSKDMARILSFGRIVIGVAAFLAPARFGRAWTGSSSDDVASVMGVRGLGARDVALGLGTLLALENGGSVTTWLEAQAVADGADALSTITNFNRMPGLRRLVMLATSSTAAYVGYKLSTEID